MVAPAGERAQERAASRAGEWRRALSMLRAKDWLHFLPLPLLTYTSGAPGAGYAIGALSAAACLGVAYAWNELVDEAEEGGESRPWDDGVPFWTVVVATALVAIVCAAANGPRAVAAASVSLIAGAVYSGGWRIKALPVVGTLTNAAIFAPLALLGPSAAPLSPSGVMLLGAFALILLQNQLVHEAADANEDARDGIRTSWRALGPAATAAWAAVMGGVGACLLWAAAPALPVALACAPLLVTTLLAAAPGRLNRPASARVLRLAHRGAALVAGATGWWFAG